MLPSMATRGNGAVVNVLSVVALAPAPLMAGYSASKAALHSLTLSLRSELRGRGISVHGVYPGGIDTRMLHGYEMQKTEPRIVAEGILAGLARDEEDIFPDRLARALSQVWLSDPKALERRFA
jgi:short-subunit dehydrogenase